MQAPPQTWQEMLPVVQLPSPPPILREIINNQGSKVLVDSQEFKKGWEWQGQNTQYPEKLWLPLDLLEDQLGFNLINEPEGKNLEWFGWSKPLSKIEKKTLKDEIGLEIVDFLIQAGVSIKRNRKSLILDLKPPKILKLSRNEETKPKGILMSLNGPAFIERLGDDLVLNLSIEKNQLNQLKRLGITPIKTKGRLLLRGQAYYFNTQGLKSPWQIVLYRIKPIENPFNNLLESQDLILSSLIRKGLIIERLIIKVGVKPLVVMRAGGDLKRLGLTLKLLTRENNQQGLDFLSQLSERSKALVAINGGFFNRIRRLPLGALRKNGIWLSGPILNRGVIAWSEEGPLQFDRLRLKQQIHVHGGWTSRVDHLNSGYVKRGLSRYTSAWGSHYKALSGSEKGLLIRGGLVVSHYQNQDLKKGVPIEEGTDLLIARAGVPLPAAKGDRVHFSLKPNKALGYEDNVIGGGPLLIKKGELVLNGRSEGFSTRFLSLTAPRTLIGKGINGTWLITLHGAAGSNPTLLESAIAAKQLGVSDALNLDGGSSTSLVIGGRTFMQGRKSTNRVHNGIGLALL